MTSTTQKLAPNFMVKTTAGCRIDWFGGTFDLSPIGQIFSEAVTINMNIGLPSEIKIAPYHMPEWTVQTGTSQSVSLDPRTNQFQDLYPLMSLIFKSIFKDQQTPNWKITTSSACPQGTGLGGSSTFGVALTQALSVAASLEQAKACLFKNEHDLVRFVQNIEAKILNGPAGCQDHWAAIRGGINLIDYPARGTQVTTKPICNKLSQTLSRILLLHSGKQRNSGVNNWALYRAVMEKDPKVTKVFEQLSALAAEARKAFYQENWEDLLSLSKSEWQIRKGLSPDIETKETRSIQAIAQAIDPKSWTRVCGAGGGGAVVVIAPVDCHTKIYQEAQKQGYYKLPVSTQGLPLQVHQDHFSDKGSVKPSKLSKTQTPAVL